MAAYQTQKPRNSGGRGGGVMPPTFSGDNKKHGIKSSLPS